MNRYYVSFLSVIIVLLFCQCRSKVSERKDELYSRYLQKNVELTIYNTPAPDARSDFNLLLLNDDDAFGKLDIPEMLKGMAREKRIAPLIIVMFDVDSKYYGVAGDGKSSDKDRDAEKFQDFMVKELIPFAKKKAGARKFASIAFAGYGPSAVPVWDAAWDRAATYHKAGIFAPRFESKKDTTLLYQKITASRKRPKTAYWIWPETSLEKNKALSLLAGLVEQKVAPEMEINESDASLREAFESFLKWAFPG